MWRCGRALTLIEDLAEIAWTKIESFPGIGDTQPSECPGTRARSPLG